MLIDWKTFVLTLWIICDRTDLYPDCNFLKESTSSCDYFFEGQLNELLVNKNDFDLFIFHLNTTMWRCDQSDQVS